MKVYLCLILLLIALSAAEFQRAGGITRIHRGRLQSPKIRELIKFALGGVSPCAELADVLCGTMQIVNGIKYRFKIRTTQKPHCREGIQRPPISVIRIHVPADINAKPSFKME